MTIRVPRPLLVVLALLFCIAVGATGALVLASDDGPSATNERPASAEPGDAGPPPEIGDVIYLDPLGAEEASGTANIATQDGELTLIVQARLEPNRRGEAYQVWLYNSDDDALSLGAQVTSPGGRYLGAGAAGGAA